MGNNGEPGERLIMDTVLSRATDDQLDNAVQENLFAMFRDMAAALPHGELHENERLGLHRTFPMSPMFNGV